MDHDHQRSGIPSVLSMPSVATSSSVAQQPFAKIRVIRGKQYPDTATAWTFNIRYNSFTY